MRVVYALQGLVVGIVALAIGSLGPGAGTADDGWTRLPPRAALAAAPCPEPDSADLGNLNPEKLEAARRGEYEVFGPEPTQLVPPIDWTEDPLGAHRYRQNLQKLRFLAPLLASWRDTGNTDDLGLALEVGLDWVAENPRGDAGTPLEAWSDKVTGDRVPFLAYLLRAAACAGVGSPADHLTLLEALAEHGRVLAAEKLYVPDNHGLFVDLGLIRLVDFLPFLERGQDWRALARERFEETLRGRLADGFWLEHSSAYQFLAIRALERMIAEYGADPELDALLAEMRTSAGWLVKPSGEMTQFGDSDLEQVPDWALAEDTTPGTRAALDAGFAFVRAPGPEGGPGYLAVTDGFHNTTHKHADELSFELFDEGMDVVTDTGLYDKDPGPIRDFVVSNRAHSTLVVDGLDLPIGDEANAYGSGLTATGEGDGWFAIEGRNRLLEAAQGVSHRRLFLYRPGELLVIVDRVESDLPHTYTRYLHFGRDIEVSESGTDEGAFELMPIEGAVYEGPDTVEATTTQANGQEEPLQGFTSPSFRRFVPRTTLATTTQGTSETFVTTLALDADLPGVEEVDAGGSGVVLTLDDGRTVAVSASGEELSIDDSAV